MRLLLLCLALMFGMGCQAADPQTPSQEPTVEITMGHILTIVRDPSPMTQPEMDKFLPAIGINVKIGYQLAFLYSVDTTHSLYVEAIPARAHLVMLTVGEHFVVGIFPENQDAPTSKISMEDCVEAIEPEIDHDTPAYP